MAPAAARDMTIATNATTGIAVFATVRVIVIIVTVPVKLGKNDKELKNAF